MILYDATERMGFLDFGILIPIDDSKASRTFAVLCQDPEVGPRIKAWHIARVDETLTREDLQRVHSRNYVERLFSADLEKEIVRTYELKIGRAHV